AMEALTTYIQPLCEPRDLNVRDVLQIEARKRQPSEILFARYAIRVSFAEGRVVGLKSPRYKSDETAGTFLKRAQSLQMLYAMRDGFSESEHHRRGRRNSESVRDLHYIEPFFRVAFGSTALAYLIDENLASASGNRIQSGFA